MARAPTSLTTFFVTAKRGLSYRRGSQAVMDAFQNTPKQVAARCGFADADVLRRAFNRHVGVTPAEYRKRHARLSD